MPKPSTKKSKPKRASRAGRGGASPRPPKAPPTLPAGRRVSRPSELTTKDRRQLVGMIGIGVPIEDACRAVGLVPSRFRAWMDERDEDPEVVAFRDEVLRADGQGVAQQVKLLWDGGRVVPVHDPGGNVVGSRVEVSKTLCEQHRFLLARRRPEAFSGAPFLRGQGHGGGGSGPGGGRGDPVESDVAEQIVAVLEAAGAVLPADVLEAVGVPREGA